MPRLKILSILCFVFIFAFLDKVTFAAGVVEYRQRKAQQQQALQQQQAQAYQQKLLSQQGIPPTYQQGNNPQTAVANAQQKQAQSGDLRNFIYPDTNFLSSNDPVASEEVNMEQIWKELEISSEVWMYIMDPKPKEITIQRYIDWYAKQGIKIKRPASFYVSAIDSMASQNEALLKNSFKDVFMIVAVLEYDFDNGQDRDALARQILGEPLYSQNRKRLGL